MKIAILGTGRMGKGLLKTFYQAYPQHILFSSRDVARAQETINLLNLNLKAVTTAEALAAADIIIPTFWYADLLPWVKANEQALRGKIIIDITNPFNDDFSDLVTAYDTSSAEELQKIVPGSTVVGAFKNTYWVVFDRPILQGIKSDIFVTADEAETREKIINLLKPLPFRVLDAGNLKNNRTIERMTLLSGYLARQAGSHPRIAYNLWGLEHEGLSS